MPAMLLWRPQPHERPLKGGLPKGGALGLHSSWLATLTPTPQWLPADLYHLVCILTPPPLSHSKPLQQSKFPTHDVS